MRSLILGALALVASLSPAVHAAPGDAPTYINGPARMDTTNTGDLTITGKYYGDGSGLSGVSATTVYPSSISTTGSSSGQVLTNAAGTAQWVDPANSIIQLTGDGTASGAGSAVLTVGAASASQFTVAGADTHVGSTTFRGAVLFNSTVTFSPPSTANSNGMQIYLSSAGVLIDGAGAQAPLTIGDPTYSTFTVTTSGRVGIGLFSPCSTCTLHVNGGVASNGTIQAKTVKFDDGTTMTTAASGGTPGGASGQIQYNNASAFGGLDWVVGTTSVTISSPTTRSINIATYTWIGNGVASGIKSWLTVGHGNLAPNAGANPTTIPMVMACSGGCAYSITDQSDGLENNIGVDSTGAYIGPNRSTQRLRIRSGSNVTAMDVTSTGTVTMDGFAFRLAVKTKAQMDAITPVVGDQFTCSDCTVPYDTCVATGATLSGFRAVLNSAISTVVSGTLVAKGCGTNN